MKYRIQVSSIYELGSRDNQEDSLYPPKGKESASDRVFILCDGMGGHESGEVASGAVCEAMGSSVMSIKNGTGEDAFSDADFRDALSAGLSALDARDNGAEKKMGTTMTFLKLHDEGATVAHIGDSRVYHIRPGADAEKTEILFETVDHSLVNDLIRIGELTPEEAKRSRQKNIITRAMQPNMERPPKADIYHTVDILPGDYFYMCSDGMLEEMEDSNIRFIFSERGGDDAAKVRMLTKVTKDNKDNHSAFIIHILEVKDELIQDAENERAWSAVFRALVILGVMVLAGAVYYYVKK